VNKSELIKQLAEKTQISLEEADTMVHTMITGMKKALCNGGRVEIRGFCNFAVRSYDAYTGRNPKQARPCRFRPKGCLFLNPVKNLKNSSMNDAKKGC
jgi:Bacterial nucleoid DNA-binding protein